MQLSEILTSYIEVNSKIIRPTPMRDIGYICWMPYISSQTKKGANVNHLARIPLAFSFSLILISYCSSMFFNKIKLRLYGPVIYDKSRGKKIFIIAKIGGCYW